MTKTVRRVWRTLCAAVLAAALFAVPVSAEGPVPEAASVAVTVTDAWGTAHGELTDQYTSSKLTASGETALTVAGTDAFSSLYLQFDRPCTWKATLPDGTVLSGGENGFIHEYLPLGAAVSSLTLTIPDGSVLCEVYAFGEGEPPSWVQRWEPPCEDGADLLVLPTHADDEHLWFGGTMPYYAGELGYKVQVAYMTNHWGEPYRPHELLNGLWTVGITYYPLISDFPDLYASKASLESAIQVYGEDTVTAWQVELLRRFTPKVVVAHDINGEYGHGAHKLNASTLLKALELSGDPATYPESAAEYGVYQVQKCYLHLWAENQILVEWEKMPLSRFEGKTALEMAAEGFACHVSQTPYFSVQAGGSYDCRKFGLAYTTVGADTPGVNDMFENVVWPEPEPEPEPEPSSEVSEESTEPSAVEESEEGSLPASSQPTEESQPAPDSAPVGTATYLVWGVLGFLLLLVLFLLIVLLFSRRRK